MKGRRACNRWWLSSGKPGLDSFSMPSCCPAFTHAAHPDPHLHSLACTAGRTMAARSAWRARAPRCSRTGAARGKTGKDCDLCRTAPSSSSLGVASVAMHYLPPEPYLDCFHPAMQVRQAARPRGAAAGEAAAGRRRYGRRGGGGCRHVGAAAGGRLTPAAVEIMPPILRNQFCALQST